ncbi:stress responsive A/B barrel domain-containing protein [Radiomyces spectabilis]|uniref:stress responsive A/B barrel domain-containing protein n=1 Tax=Radiomyces spectabilis TaxID=64574 RepID=UPI00221F3374|nr:stress responsive A/B barrel domain-containing protein [Radiomyces spectabilis]KAI8393504.1 stress responsive A/B barrel domain-containing protein [Radiomyces spectabilis]
MKLVHIVIVKFKPEVDEATKEKAMEDVLALKNDIPEIKAATAGKTFTDRSKGFEWGWVVELEKKEDLATYSDHPAHLAYVSKYKPLFADLIALDYMS